MSVVHPDAGRAVWLVSLVARPGPGAEFGAEQPAAGAFVNVYVVETTAAAAESIARQGVSEAGWWIEEGEEPQRLDLTCLEAEAIDLVEQARADGAVWVFHTWPPGAEDDEGPLPG